MNPTVAAFMAQAKEKAEILAVKLAQVELSTWSDQTETENKKYYGYTDKTLAKRKKELQKKVA
jgi:hypothetical protein